MQRDFTMKKIYLFLSTNFRKKDLEVIGDYSEYEIEKIYLYKVSFKEWLNTYEPCYSDDVLAVVSRPFVIGESLDDFMTKGLQAIEKGLKIVFLYRYNLSFEQLIDYNVFSTIEQQKAAFCSLYGVVMTDVYAHKNGRKRSSKEVILLRNYWLAYIYKNSRKFKGALTTIEISKKLQISSNKLKELKEDVKKMLANGKEQELDEMVMNELYKGMTLSSEKEDSKRVKNFKEKLTKALSSSNTQLDLFTDEEVAEQAELVR